MANNPTVKVSNYLVPAVGGTSSVHVRYAGNGTAEFPIGVRWKDYDLDGQPFSPSGFFCKNYSETDSIFILVPEVGLTFEVLPGGFMGRQYPAPFEHTVELTGAGDGDIVFVNFPVIPFSDAAGGDDGAVTIANGADVALGAIGDSPVQTPIEDATLISVAKALMAMIQGIDSDFEFLPQEFDSAATSYTYLAGNLRTEVKVVGGYTYTRTYTYTGSDLTGISAWVKS